MKPEKDTDYIIVYAESLRENNKLFEQQRKIIESQLKSSKEIFGRMFKGKFKEKAKEYLKEVKLI